uniref:uncharacterized protein LOC103791246 isoform X3 n=1 Tax=Callithrix jacchus TaxID=9483 RepID=UPI0023DD3B37|nr:uncharacterized protein LOC103791246 isoform X3 [Callithrix jacchus]
MGGKHPHIGASRASCCLPTAPWGPASTSPQPLGGPAYASLVAASPGPDSPPGLIYWTTSCLPAAAFCSAPDQLPATFCRPEAFSSGAFWASVLPRGGLDRPCYHLTLAPFGPALDSPQPPQHQLLPADGFPRRRSCLPAFWLRPQAQRFPHSGSLEPSTFLTVAHWSPAFSSQWLIGAQHFPHSGSLEPSTSLTVARWSPVLFLQWLIGAQCFFYSGSLEPSASLTVAHWSPALPSQWLIGAQLMPVANLSRPSSRLTFALSLGPGAPSQGSSSAQLAYQTLPGQLLPPGVLSRPKASFPCPASPGPASACARPIPGPACDFHWTLQAQLVASLWPLLRPSTCLWQPVSTGPTPSLPVAPWGQADASRRPSRAQHLPAGILSWPRTSSERPDFTDAIILRKGASVEHVCPCIHRSLASEFKYALVWGTSTKYSPQQVGLTHTMEHEVIQIVKK